MGYFEIFKMASASLKENMLRSLLTMLAIIIGVFAIIASVTAVLVIDTYFNNTLKLMGSNTIYVSKFPAVQMGDGSAYRNRKNITFSDFERLRDLTLYGRQISPSRSFSYTTVEYEDRSTDPNISIRGSNEFYLDNNAYAVIDGRNMTSEDLEYARNVAILGADVTSRLFKQEYPIGKRIRIQGKPYQVIGVLEPKGSTFGNSQDEFVLIPYTTALANYGNPRGNIGIQLNAPDINSIERTIDELTGIMRVLRKVNPNEPNDFDVTTNASLQSSFDQFTGVLYIFGIVVGGIALLGAGIGVMNIMLVSVTERTKEIGIRKAIGATRRALILQFLTEAVVVCQVGGFFGLILGVVGGNVLALTMESQLVFPWAGAFGGIIGLTIIGLVFGVYPAIKASRLDPIESLRYE